MIRTILLTTWLIAATMVFGVSLSAQQKMANDEMSFVPAGTYEPFSVWQQVRLGATSLVNPSIAGNAAVVNSYAIEDLPQDAIAKLKAGGVVFARKTGDGKYETLTGDEVKEIIEKIKAEEATDNVAVLTFQSIPPFKSKKLIIWPTTL